MKFKKYGRTWYTTRKEALKNRMKGDMIYYDIGMKSYYLISPKKKSFWNI